ncbi:MAG: YdeI/OmpD-associated family protein [Acidobacteriaceae bacterium]|jgi:uncharacterized protein YdeI (YjbR/CyaY-like superfamily)|nr:YdeI/OmpD-associated family protein [Acidobacteriaceae bacterium]
MGARDPRVDVYIDAAADFAQPILAHLRAVVHEACPGVEETVKWRMPTFMYEGRILCNIAAFKQHCSLNFWRGSSIVDAASDAGMGQFGRITAMTDLPAKKTLIGYVRKAMAVSEGKAPSASRAAKPEAAVPDDLAAALKQRTHAKARAVFAASSPSHRREYIEWINEAKREDTRAKRLATTLEWLAEGKPRNWKYQK